MTSALLALSLIGPGRAVAADALRFDFSDDPLLPFLEHKREELHVRRCAAAPSIDGVLDDAAWGSAVAIELPRAADNVPKTVIRISYDDQALYFGVVCACQPGVEPVGEPAARDAPTVWKGDHIELWLDPSGEAKETRQFVLGAGDAIFDLLNNDAAFGPDWGHAVTRDKEEWRLEIAIPKAALGLTDWVREFGFNIGRNGPKLSPHAWYGKYGQTTDSALVLPDVPRQTAGKTRELPPVAEGALAAVEGEGLTIGLERSYARAGERFIEIDLAVSHPRVPLQQCRVAASLFAVTGAQPLAEASTAPARRRGTLLADLRRLALQQARLVVELYAGKERLAAASLFLEAQTCEAPFADGRRIEILLDRPEGVPLPDPAPVTFGVPFAAGALWDANEIRFVDEKGAELPHQKEVMALWAPEGAIKWVRFDALAPPQGNCFVEAARPAAPAAAGPKVQVTERDGQVIVDAGAARYVLAPGPSPIVAIFRSDRRVAASEGARGLFLIDQKGRLARASAEEQTMIVEARGPVAACVRFEGWYATADNERVARHITRVECFAGRPEAAVTHTLVLTRDTNEIWFKQVGWELSATAGTDSRALFADSRADWKSVREQALANGVAGAFMLQDQHYFFAHGSNHFSIATLAADGAAKTVFEAEECGDWAALKNAEGGLAVACRDAARQHPKEFEIHPDKLVLHLFSNRVGEELDFRTATLARKWGLQNWYDRTHSKHSRDLEFVNKVLAIPSNAIGWAKTHQLLFMPLAPDSAPADLARGARLQATPLYATAAPEAIYASKAMGPIHPSTPDRFPVVEKAAKAAFRHFVERDAEWGEHGFIDYFAGPHLTYLRYDHGTYVGMFRYCHATYTLRPDLWTLYARTGDRQVRAFAEGTNLTFMDAVMAHWDGKETVRGMHRTNRNEHKKLPFYWGPGLQFEISSTTNHDAVSLLYYLAGCRRAADCMREYADGIKRAWTPAKAARVWRPLMLFRLLTQAYEFTFDPVLKAMAEETFNRFADAETALGLSKEYRPYQSVSYKTNVDTRAIIEAWETFGDGRYHRLALKMAHYWWQLLGTQPIIYTNPQARIGSFLYGQTGAPMYPELLALQLRRAAWTYDPETNVIRPGTRLAAHNATFYLEGAAYALDAITRAGADKARLTSWIGYDDVGSDTSVIVRKDKEGTLSLHAAVDAGDIRREPIGGIRVNPIGVQTISGLNMVRISERPMDFQGYHQGSIHVSIPKDAPAGEYEVLFPRKGLHFVIAESRAPLVLHAPRYWQPTLLQAPPARYWFAVPEESREAQIFFEGSARLFAPDGAPAFDGKPQHGWIDLPGDKSGVWSFEIVENRLIRVRNLPPFFAVGERETYFTPSAKPWRREPIPAPAEAPPADMTYGPGAIRTPGNQSACIAGQRAFHLDPGDPHPSGDGGRFLPHKQGTIEFWMKPLWNSVDLVLPEKDGKTITLTKRFALGRTPGPGSDFSLFYTLSEESKNLGGMLFSAGPEGRKNLRTYRYNTIFERDEWLHLAWVWGQLQDVATHKGTSDVLWSRIYINGKAGKQRTNQYPGSLPASPMSALLVGYASNSVNINAFVDELRISDVQRYTEDFTPPSRMVEFEVDEHTRALFHFNGDTAGLSHDWTAPLPARLGR